MHSVHHTNTKRRTHPAHEHLAGEDRAGWRLGVRRQGDGDGGGTGDLFTALENSRLWGDGAASAPHSLHPHPTHSLWCAPAPTLPEQFEAVRTRSAQTWTSILKAFWLLVLPQVLGQWVMSPGRMLLYAAWGTHLVHHSRQTCPRRQRLFRRSLQ